ncbi:hypothetical protein B0H12DRAFT_241708 [Mycena haematopus]|nr:hypothetical protein B0H12DRAFT_241708 [Mycena haematopus]
MASSSLRPRPRPRESYRRRDSALGSRTCRLDSRRRRARRRGSQAAVDRDGDAPAARESRGARSAPTQSSTPAAATRRAAVALVYDARRPVETPRQARASSSGPITRVSSSPARVPSSVSPSPLRRGVSVSPPKIPDHRTKALQDSIVSLLGKRPATPEDADALPVGRVGKRGRAQRSTRQPSDVLPVLEDQGRQQEVTSVFGAGRSFSPGAEDSDGGALEGLSMGADEQSLRVMYEDPGSARNCSG